MKVRCILAVNNPEPGKESEARPEVGDVCVVTNQRYLPHYRAVYYQLAGYNPDNGYAADHFAILPDISADEMEEEVREAIVNLETQSA